MATQQQPAATSSEDCTSYSSYSGTNSYTGQSSLTSSVQIHNYYNEVDENSTIDSKPAAFENGLQSLTTTSDLIQQRIQQQGEVSACSTNTKEFSLPSSFGGGRNGGGDGSSTINDTIASDTVASNDNDGGSSTRASASIGSRNTEQERNDLLQQQQQQQQMEVYNNSSHELVSVNSSNNNNLQLAQDNDNNNSKEDQLTIRINKETKPMMHLLRMLKEMDTNDTDTTSSTADNSNNQLSINNSNNPKNKAISSLISDFEQEVTLIEHRIKDESLVTYNNSSASLNNNEQSSTSLASSIQPLPPNWIALEDPNSGDVYYANEVTGVTQWERPGRSNTTNLNDSRSTFNDSRSTFNDSYNQSGSTLNDSRSTLNDSYQSNNNKNKYNQQSTSSTTFIGNVIQKSVILRNSRLANSYQDSQQSSNFQDSQQSNNNSSYTNMSSSLNDSAFTSTTETTTSTNIDDNDLPPDWIAIIDSDTGETYYANEVTGESTWEKPISHQQSQQQTHESDTQDDHDNVSSNSNNNDELLPLGWFAAVDEQSGDTYYCNETTGETTWDRPSSSNKEVVEDVKETGGAVDQGADHNDNRPQDDNDDDDLPPGWFTAVDQDSGDTYYCNEATGETTWDKPTMPTTSIEETSDREQHSAAGDKSQAAGDHFGSSVGDNMRRLSISGDFENSDSDLPSSTTSSSGLPLGWFAAVDEQSGDTYYCNEATGETTWDRPTQPAIVEDETTASSNTNLSSNQGESQDGDQLPNGWFSVTDPASGDVYYCNEVTGETTWDKPTIDKATTDLLLSRTSNNVDPTVYEDDSVTSSKGY